jgi:hypothetical protein
VLKESPRLARGVVAGAWFGIGTALERTSSRGRDRAEARALGHGKTQSRFLGPPCNPGRSDFPIPVLALAIPERSFQDRGSSSARSHTPHPFRFTSRLVLQSWLLRLTPLAIRGPPSAQSSFACHKCDSWQGGVQRHLEEHYPFFIAPTSSCAKPASSSGLRVSTLISRGPGRLLRAPAGNWFFPTLSLQVFARMLEPLIPSGGRVHLPVTSPNLVGLPQLPPLGRLPESPRKETSCGGCCEIVAIPYVQASWFVRHPGLPYRCAVSLPPHRAAVTFTPEQSPAPLPVQASGC